MLVASQAAAGRPTARPILPRMRGDSELWTVPAQRRGFGDRQVATARLRHAWRLLAFAIVASAAVVFVLEIIGEVVLGSGRVAIDYRTHIPAAQSVSYTPRPRFESWLPYQHPRRYCQLQRCSRFRLAPAVTRCGTGVAEWNS